MKKIAAIGFGLLFSLSGLAAYSDYFRAVLASEAAQETVDQMRNQGMDFYKIEQTQTYRCPGCYEFTLTFRGNGESQAKFTTSQDLGSPTIKVTHKSE